MASRQKAAKGARAMPFRGEYFTGSSTKLGHIQRVSPSFADWLQRMAISTACHFCEKSTRLHQIRATPILAYLQTFRLSSFRPRHPLTSASKTSWPIYTVQLATSLIGLTLRKARRDRPLGQSTSSVENTSAQTITPKKHLDRKRLSGMHSSRVR